MLRFVVIYILGVVLGIVKISDPLHEEVRKSSNVMSRSMNAQAEFWLKIGMLAERNPTFTFYELIQAELEKEEARAQKVESIHAGQESVIHE